MKEFFLDKWWIIDNETYDGVLSVSTPVRLCWDFIDDLRNYHMILTGWYNERLAGSMITFQEYSDTYPEGKLINYR